MGRALDDRLDEEIGRSIRGVAEEQLVGQAPVAVASLGVEDPQLRPPARRAESVPGDHHLGPLADDVAAQPDPRSAGELQPEARRLGHRPVHRAGQAGRLEEDEEGTRTTSQGDQPMEPIGDSGRARAGHST